MSPKQFGFLRDVTESGYLPDMNIEGNPVADLSEFWFAKDTTKKKLSQVITTTKQLGSGGHINVVAQEIT